MDPTWQVYMIGVLAFLTVVALGGALLLWRRERPVTRLDMDDLTMPAGPTGGAMTELVGLVGHLASSKPSNRLRERLAQAGYHGPNAASIYLGLKMIALVVGLGAGLLLAGLTAHRDPVLRIVLIALMGLALFLLPNAVVSWRRRRRRNEVRGFLPDALDLLEVCVSSGMGTDMAWNAVAEEMRRVNATLADEMALANLEIHLGAHRAEAMRHMAERTGEEDLNALAAILVQSERLGTSIADALQAFATSMRETRRTRAQEAAEAMAVKLLIPMIMCIFPAILIVLIGPAGMRMAEVFSQW